MAETNTNERRLLDVIAAYYVSARSGTEPDPREWIDRHPELVPQLSEFFADQQRLHRLGSNGTGLEPSTPDFGDYVLIRELGRGGMGVVFEALQPKLGRRIALKVQLSGPLASTDDRQRFRNEAEAIAHLDHPQIIPIHEVGESDGRGYFTMKLVDGGSLADHLDKFAHDTARTCRLLAAVARAIDYAHRRGVLHRDLKPSNILLDAADQPYVSDFGLAKRLEADAELTRSGALLGSPSYMAPEQTTGHKASITTATDVYGLGAVLYALLTGRPPFRGESALETIEQVRDLPPEPPSTLNSRVDRDLETICLKALEKDPDRRYASAGALADDLERWLAGESIAARPSGQLDRLRRWCVRPQRIRETGLLFLGLGVCLGAFAALGFATMPFLAGELQRPDAMRLHLVRCIVFAYLPMSLIGHYIIRRRRWALWAGLAHATILTINMIGSIFDVLVLDLGGGSMENRAGRFPFELLCTTLFSLQALACLVALAADHSQRAMLRRRGGAGNGIQEEYPASK
jgi:hypothetical protein